MAVVTRASSGIGEAIARELSRRGWRCVLLARHADLLEAVATGIDGEWEACDIAEREQVNEVAARPRAAPRDRAAREQRGRARRGNSPRHRPRARRAGGRRHYLGGVWCLQAFKPGLTQPYGAPKAHVVNVVSRLRDRRLRSRGRLRGGEARSSRSRARRRRCSGRAASASTVTPGFVEVEGSRSARSCAARSCAAS